jgi:hypothetical protein
MFFGRRKHAATAPAAPAPLPMPQLTDELIFAAVQRSLADVFGDDGDWTVTRRSPEQKDLIFHEVLVHSIATSVTARVAEVRESLTADGGPLGLLRAPRLVPAPVEHDALDGEAEPEEPAALAWQPAPITRWADLKRPVTGPTAIIDRAIDTEGKAA